MKPPVVKTIPCWNCRATMDYYATAGVYHFFKCPVCKVEKAVWKEDETIAGPRIATEKQSSPRSAWPGQNIRGNEGRKCSRISQGN